MSNFDDDRSSITSMMSEMSVNVDGNEYNLESYISETFRNIQRHINELEVCVGYLAFADDRGLTVEEYLPKFLELSDHVLEAAELFQGLIPAMIDCLDMNTAEKKEFKAGVKAHKEKQKVEKKKRREEQLKHVKEWDDEKKG